jgi:cell fate regulator YaaT (PSP1 superfamily)
VWPHYFVRVGIFGQVGRLSSAGGTPYPRGKRVICRTNRGLEVGEVLSNVHDSPPAEFDGTILRPVSVEDDLLLARLEKKKDAAYAACVAKLEEHQFSAVLMDVEHLFDGRSLYFYFLGDVTPELAALTEELAATYDTVVQFQKFAETLTTGCGPDCGTESAAGHGCGSGGCSTCAVVQACGTHKH